MLKFLLTLSLLFGGGSSGVMCLNEVKKIPKLFVIGDSYADTGNMEQSAVSWKSPYGLTFPGKPAGRYSDGLIATDLLAKMLGAKLPYLQRTHGKSKRKPDRGMNFAYGESGIFSSRTTPSPNISEQAEFLNRRHLDHSVDKMTPSDVAVLIYSGKDYFDFITKKPSNDHIADTKEIVEKVVKYIMWSLRDFEALNFKKVGVTSLLPIGCLPRFTSESSFKSCNESLSEIVKLHNKVLKYHIDTKGYGHVIIDFHDAFMKVLKNKGGKTRFKTPLKPCCEGDCGRVDDKGAKKYKLCDDPKSAFFWDDINPTQQGWKSIFSILGNPFSKINKF